MDLSCVDTPCPPVQFVLNTVLIYYIFPAQFLWGIVKFWLNLNLFLPVLSNSFSLRNKRVDVLFGNELFTPAVNDLLFQLAALSAFRREPAEFWAACDNDFFFSFYMNKWKLAHSSSTPRRMWVLSRSLSWSTVQAVMSCSHQWWCYHPAPGEVAEELKHPSLRTCNLNTSLMTN